MAGERRVVVVGSGAAGLAAAVAAASAGASVTVLEAAELLGGTTAISGGGTWIPGNPWAASRGVADSMDDARRYLVAMQHGDTSNPLTDVFLEEAVRVASLIEQRTPIRWQSLAWFPDYHPELDGGGRGRALEILPLQAPPEVLARVRENPYKFPPVTVNEYEFGNPPDSTEIARREREGVVVHGRGIVVGLVAALESCGGRVLPGIRASGLLRSGDAVTGVVARGEEFHGEVVLASGGFERNQQLVRSFLGGPMLAPAGTPASQGDGLVMAMRAGSALRNMSDAWWMAGIHVPGETIDGQPFFRVCFAEGSIPGGIIVDTNARRFVNESVNYYGLGRSLLDRDASAYSYPRIPSWLIFDSVRRTLPPLGPLDTPDDPEWLPKAATIAQLASVIGLPPRALEETVGRFNEGVAAGIDEFGRLSYGWDAFSSGATALRPISEPPFYALKLLPGCGGTKGGPATDANGRVLRLEEDDIIPGLYAAGNAAAYPFGTGYPGPGASIGPALVFGWLAGESAAAVIMS